MGKYVSEAYKEVHKKIWGENNPGGKDIVQKLIEMYKTPSRWNKAIQHIKEAGMLEDSPKDIGLLIKEIAIDTRKECEDEIKEYLFKWAWQHIQRGITRGMPEWYKEKLMDKQFEKEDRNES